MEDSSQIREKFCSRSIKRLYILHREWLSCTGAIYIKYGSNSFLGYFSYLFFPSLLAKLKAVEEIDKSLLLGSFYRDSQFLTT